jgi:hypothetical protein
MAYHERRIAVDDINDWISEHWPTGVPTDCTRLQGDSDCLERGLDRPECCLSCQTYDELLQEKPSEE